MNKLLFATLILLTAVSSSSGQRVPEPEGVFYYQPAAGVFGGEALWMNPAGLASYEADGMQIMGDYREGKWFKSNGMLVHRKGIGFAYRSLVQPFDSTIKEWVVGLGLQLGSSLEIGSSYRWITSGPLLYDGRKLWTIGIMRRPGGPFSWGIVFGNLNRSWVEGQRTETELRYSLGYRPLGEKLTLSADALLSTKTKLKNAEFIYHVEFTPRSGLYLNGFIDSHRNFELGLRVNVLKSFFGSRSGFNRKGDGQGTTIFLGTTSLRQPSITPETPRRLVLPLSLFGDENPVRPIFGRSSAPFVDLILALYRAGKDPSVGEILIHADRFGYSFGQAQELRQAIVQLRNAGKRVIFYDANPGNVSYYVGTAADQIMIPPVSQLNLIGLRAELTFYAGTMEKLGIRADMVRIGDYKTAVEPFTRTASSDENKEQINRLLDNLFSQLLQGISAGRGISADSVRSLIDLGPFTSQEAKQFGLVDGLAYYGDLEKQLGGSKVSIGYAAYLRDSLTTGSWQSPPTLALVVADGEIVGRHDTGSPLDTDEKVSTGAMATAFEQARLNRNVKGIIFRIDSPGGDALASDAIHHAASTASKSKPIAVSMAGVAASGGYYVAMTARRLFADPATITGSIGIFGGKLDMSGLHQKIGLNKELYTRGKFSGLLSTSRPFTDEERAKYQNQLSDFYDQFIGLVAANRGLSVDSIDQLGRGRVWTGEEALTNGLIDELGGLWETLEYMKGQAGLDEYRIEIYPKRRPLFVFPVRNIFSSLARVIVGGKAVESAVSATADLSAEARLIARMPYDLEIN